MKKLLLASVVTLATAQAYADNYQAEVGLGYGSIDKSFEFDDAETSIGGDMLNAYATVYFDKVDTSKGPLAEAAFLSKASDLTLTYSTVEFDEQDDGDDSATIGFRYVGAEQWILQADYNSANDNTVLGLGAYVSDNIEFILNYTSGDTSLFGLSSHGLFPLQEDTALSFDIGYANNTLDDGPSVTAVNLGAGYYFNKNVGVSVDYTKNAGAANSSTTAISADWFVQENIDLSLSYSTTLLEDDLIDKTTTDLISLNAAYRF